MYIIIIITAQLAESQRLQKEAESQIAKIAPQAMQEDQDIVTIPKPKGEAGDKKNGFNLRKAMQLDDVAHKDLYDAIQVCGLELSYLATAFPSNFCMCMQ
jgi:hypothetical protein